MELPTLCMDDFYGVNDTHLARFFNETDGTFIGALSEDFAGAESDNIDQNNGGKNDRHADAESEGDTRHRRGHGSKNAKRLHDNDNVNEAGKTSRNKRLRDSSADKLRSMHSGDDTATAEALKKNNLTTVVDKSYCTGGGENECGSRESKDSDRSGDAGGGDDESCYSNVRVFSNQDHEEDMNALLEDADSDPVEVTCVGCRRQFALERDGAGLCPECGTYNSEDDLMAFACEFFVSVCLSV